MEIVLIRHGLTENNAKGLMCGRTDVPLSREGHDSICEMVSRHPYPRVERIYCSPAIRCMETADCSFSEMKVERRQHEGLWEFFFGTLEGKPASEIWNNPDYAKGWREAVPDFAFPGGETFEECAMRGVRAMTEICREAAQDGLERFAVVSHGLVLFETLRRMMPQEAFAKIPKLIPNGRGFLMEAVPDGSGETFVLHYRMTLPEGEPFPDTSSSPYVNNGKENSESSD